MKSLIAVILAVILATGGMTVLFCQSSIGVSEAGLIIDPVSGTITGPVVGPKWFVRSPLQYVIRVSISTQYLILSDTDPNADFGGLMCFSTEGIEVEFDMVVRFGISLDDVVELYKSYPQMNWELTTINSITSEATKTITKRFSWVEMRSKRGEMASEVQDALRGALTMEPSLKGAIINVEVDLKNIAYPAALSAELNRAIAAEQSIVTAQNNRTAMLIIANATAQSKIIEAMGEAQSAIVRARGEAEALRIMIEAVGPDGWKTYYVMQKLKELSPNVGTLIIGQDVETVLPLK